MVLVYVTVMSGRYSFVFFLTCDTGSISDCWSRFNSNHITSKSIFLIHACILNSSIFDYTTGLMLMLLIVISVYYFFVCFSFLFLLLEFIYETHIYLDRKKCNITLVLYHEKLWEKLINYPFLKIQNEF